MDLVGPRRRQLLDCTEHVACDHAGSGTGHTLDDGTPLTTRRTGDQHHAAIEFAAPGHDRGATAAAAARR